MWQECEARANASQATLTTRNLPNAACVWACLPAGASPLSSTDARVSCSSLPTGDSRAGAIVCQDESSVLSCSNTLSGQIAMFVVTFLFWCVTLPAFPKA